MTSIQHQQQQTQQQEQINYYDSLYHLAEVSAYKLNNPSEKRNTEPTLRRQLLVRNLLVLSSNLILSEQNTQEEVWLNACFDELMDEEEDTFMEEEELGDQGEDNKSIINNDNLLVMAFPFDYVSHSDDDQTVRKGTLFLM